MHKTLRLPLGLLLALALLLSACGAPTATQAVAPTQPVVAQPTAVPATALPEPTLALTAVPLVAPDAAELLEALYASLPADQGFGGVSAAALSEELAGDAPFLVDVREPAEIEADGYIAGAINLPIRTLSANLDKLPALDPQTGSSAPIVVYCASGQRGGYALASLRLLGYENVRNLNGGLGAWNRANLPVEAGLPAAPEVLGAPTLDQGVFELVDSFLTNMPDGYYGIKSDALNAALAEEPPFLLDVRTTAEWDRDGYLEGALSVPFNDLFANLDQLPATEAKIVVYCASGYRGAITAMALRLLGYTDVSNLNGGLGAWKAASLPVMGWVNWSTVWGEFLAEMPDHGMYLISAADLNTALVENPPFLLDVREPAEIEADGYIAGAINLPIRELTANLDKLPALDTPIVVYCASGHRGALAIAALNLLGYADVRNLGGGLGAWKNAELPLEVGLPTAPLAGALPEVDATRLRDLDAFLAGMPDGFFLVKAADLNVELGEAVPPIVVDLRTAAELESGTINGALLIPVDQLPANLSQFPDKTAEIVVLCQSGHRGAIALMALRMLGYESVRNLGGGMNAWAAAELPVETAS